jgi:Ion channel
MAFCVVVHAAGVTAALRWLEGHTTKRPWQWAWLFVQLAGWIIFVHLIEIVAWAALYVFGRAMPDLQSAIYFSAVTYTTTGYGDLLLPNQWRLAGAIEALTGILMCGWSTGFFFAVANRMHSQEAAPPIR